MDTDIKKAIDALNEAFNDDPIAITTLLKTEIPCNEDLSKHPTIMCGYTKDGRYYITAIGLLNGVLGSLGLPLIAGLWSDPYGDNSRLLEFVEYGSKSDTIST